MRKNHKKIFIKKKIVVLLQKKSFSLMKTCFYTFSTRPKIQSNLKIKIGLMRLKFFLDLTYKKKYPHSPSKGKIVVIQ